MKNHLESKPYLSEISSSPTKLWFKAKQYGWGWYPATWQGWAVLAMYLFSIGGIVAHSLLGPVSSVEAWIGIIPQAYILTVFLIIICYATGEKPAWRWGGKERRDSDLSDRSL